MSKHAKHHAKSRSWNMDLALIEYLFYILSLVAMIWGVMSKLSNAADYYNTIFVLTMLGLAAIGVTIRLFRLYKTEAFYKDRAYYQQVFANIKYREEVAA